MVEYNPEYDPELVVPGDPYTTHRHTRTWVDVLTVADRLRGPLFGVTLGGSIEHNVNRTIRGGGSITLMQADESWSRGEGLVLDDVEWGKNRLRVWMEVDGAAPFPLGTFIPSAPITRYIDGGRSVEVELLDKLHVLHRDAVPTPYALPSGTRVIPAIAAIIASAGAHATRLEASDRELAGDRVWPAGTPKLEIINELLEYIGYFSLSCDGYGRYIAAPYTDPRSRPVVREFAPGETAIHAPEWSMDLDLHDVPNEFLVISEGSADTPAIVGRAINMDPESPTSYQARGNEWITSSDTVEADNVATANAIAERRLADITSRATKLEVTHAPLPLGLQDAVTFYSRGHGPVLATVQSMTIDLSIGGQTNASWREVGLL